MHLIIGAALSALASKHMARKDGHTTVSPLLRTRGPVETLHLLKGRVRFRVRAVIGSNEKAGFVQENLIKLPPVRSVNANPVTGSVLILFDEGEISAELLFTAIIRLLGLERELESAPRGVLVKEAESAGQSLNRALFDSTNGIVDLRSAMLLLLLFAGVRKLILDRGNAFPPGFTMLFWAATLTHFI
jgi:hypothetical protein